MYSKYCVLLRFVRLLTESIFFFFNDTATTEIYTLSLHDALPILVLQSQSYPTEFLGCMIGAVRGNAVIVQRIAPADVDAPRSEEHTSELQSQSNLVCRLLLEKKKTCNHSLSLSHVCL